MVEVRLTDEEKAQMAMKAAELNREKLLLEMALKEHTKKERDKINQMGSKISRLLEQVRTGVEYRDNQQDLPNLRALETAARMEVDDIGVGQCR